MCFQKFGADQVDLWSETLTLMPAIASTNSEVLRHLSSCLQSVAHIRALGPKLSGFWWD